MYYLGNYAANNIANLKKTCRHSIINQWSVDLIE